MAQYLVTYEGDLARYVAEKLPGKPHIFQVQDAPAVTEEILDLLFSDRILAYVTDTQESALQWLAAYWQQPFTEQDLNEYNEADGENVPWEDISPIERDGGWPIPDPEDDRILVWEVDDDGYRIVWHSSGWHFDPEAHDLPGGPLEQGTLPGHRFTLNEAANF